MAPLRDDVLAVGDPVRPAVGTALAAAVANAAVFTVFAFVTTQVRAVRNGSPWQDDPYDAVVSFTLFFVPLVGVLIAMRMLLCRRGDPLPLYRVAQLLRAARVCSVLAAATYATDWSALALRADRALWNGGTPLLVAALGAVTVLGAADWPAQARARRLLPGPDTYEIRGDWLDDAWALANLPAARLPRPARALVARLERADTVGWIRGRFTSVLAAGSVFAGLLVAIGLARENGFGLLFVGDVLWFAGGAFAFFTVCDAVLQLTIRPPRGPVRQAARVAVAAGAVALPASLALRDGIAGALGLTVETPAALIVLTVVAALSTGMVAFGVALARPSPRPAVPRRGDAGHPG